MTEEERGLEVLQRCHKISRRYCGNDTAKGSELVNDIMELITFASQESEPDTPMPKKPPSPPPIPPRK
jgi:hypothetical protein